MTTYDQYAYDEPAGSQQQAAPIESTDNLPGKALNASQKKAIAAALIGTAALGGAAYGLSLLEDGDGSGSVADGNDGSGNGSDDANAHAVAAIVPVSFSGAGTGTGGDVAVIDSEPRLATLVTDDMTFDQAFAAARTEMGPGDYFEWHGNYYNTFYQHEWEGMSETEHQAFVASLGDLITPQATGQQMAHQAEAEPAHHHAAPVHHEHTHHAAAVAVVDPTPAAATEASVSVIDAIAGSDSNVTVMHVDGHTVSLIDTNHDQQTDMTLADNNVVLVDTDSDHKLDSQGAYNSGTHQLENLHALAEPVAAPDMEADNRSLPADYEQLYTSHDLNHGHDLHGGQMDTTDLGN